VYDELTANYCMKDAADNYCYSYEVGTI
jgi:hypothetical protein